MAGGLTKKGAVAGMLGGLIIAIVFLVMGSVLDPFGLISDGMVGLAAILASLGGGLVAAIGGVIAGALTN